MNREQLFEHYNELQAYVSWTEEDRERIVAIGPRLDPFLPALIDDFYAEIERHPAARKVITGGEAQIERLKGTLIRWLRKLLMGQYDADYVERRWRVGWRHVEIGLDQVYTNVALSRLRTGMIRALHESWDGAPLLLKESIRSLNKLLDLDLAIIEDAYQAEYAGRLQRNERLITLGQVAGGIAHEIRNPLNVVKTSVYYLLHARNPSPEKKIEHMHRIERQIDLADNVVTALASFARMPVPNLNPISIESVVQGALELNAPGDGIEVAIEFPEWLPPVLADGTQLQIVFGNLLRNARDAMPKGGRLTVGASEVDGAVEVAVSDTGFGIPPEDLSRIMEPLYSTKARGLGLGLAIARAILDKCQGTLRAASEVGVGSTFIIRLPVAPFEEGKPT
jgi:signal transduction histidine kinase